MENVFVMLATSSTSSANSQGGGYSLLIMMLLMFGVLYFVSIRPQQKREKADKEMRNSIQIGDEIVTLGGIMGRIVTIKDDSFTIETGADRTKIKITRAAIASNLTATEKVNAERQASIEARKAQLEAKKTPKESKSDDKKDSK